MSTISDNIVKKHGSNDSTNERSLLSSSSLLAPTKLQPIRVKALLAMSESDDDEDDDENCKSNSEETDPNQSLSPNSSLADVNTSLNIENSPEIPLNPSISPKKTFNPIQNCTLFTKGGSEFGKTGLTSLLGDFSHSRTDPVAHDDTGTREKPEEPLNYSNKQQKTDVPVSTHGPSSCQSLSSSQIVSETPIKTQLPTLRPVPSVSHRNLFHTPQEKLSRDFSNQSYLPTPATIFSQWSQSNMRHSSRVSEASGPSLPPKQELWPRSNEGRGVRRPLMETMSSECRIPVENQGYKVQESEQAPRGGFESLPEKFIPRKIISESKENRRPSFEVLKRVEEPLRSLETKPQDIQPDFSSRSSRGPVERISEPAPRLVDAVEAGKKINSALETRQEYVKPNIPSRPTTVQASVPANAARKPQISKTMSVKGVEYMLLGSLGQGMSGSVIRVQDLSAGELRAIKCVDLSRMDKDSAQGCIQEITMLAKLQAPCIIRMYNYEICNKMLYVVMELGETDLSKFLKSNCVGKRPPLTMILHYWTEMLTAVKHIHDHGVIHSDLKPANFVLVRGSLKLIDFGIASTLNADMTSVVKNTTVGTLNYISPEALMSVDDSSNQNTKFKINYKSDVWSLGCILYCLVFGQTPFQHIQNNWAKINAITNSDFKISFKQPAHTDPVPAFLIDVIRNCLQRDPKARPSVAQLLEVHYVPTSGSHKISPDIPVNILRKIKNALDDDEWREFIQIMEQFRNI